MMNDQDRAELIARWHAVHDELKQVEDLRVAPAGEPLPDFTEREGGLLEELDEIEGMLGKAWLEEHRRERGGESH